MNENKKFSISNMMLAFYHGIGRDRIGSLGGFLPAYTA